MRGMAIVAAVGICLAGAPLRADEDCSALGAEVSGLAGEIRGVSGELRGLSSLREEIHTLANETRERDDAIREVAAQAQAEARVAAREATELRGRLDGLVAGPFLASPPPGSDTTGVAQHAVFAPRLEIDLSQRHDLVSFVLKRVETQGAPVVASFDLVADQESVGVPIDHSGALYVIEWVTSEGYTLTLVLRDGATGQAAATTQVRPQQRSGRFIFVGYDVGGCCAAD